MIKTMHTRSDVVETITPRDVYILEGLFVFMMKKSEKCVIFLYSLIQMRIFVLFVV